MKLYRVIIPTNDIEQAQRFYENLFGLKGERVSPGRHYFNLNGTILACYDPKADGDEDKESWSFHYNQYIYISVKSLGKIYDKVKNTGVHLSPIEEMPWGERLFYMNDPFGTPICFVDEETVFTGSGR